MAIRAIRIPNECRSAWASRRAGFTLVELMIVISIIGILAAIAYPAILQWLPSIQLKAATQQMYSDMQRARSLAIKNNTKVTVTFTPGCNDVGRYTYTDSNGVVLVDQILRGNLCLNASTFTDGISGFSPRGIPLDVTAPVQPFPHTATLGHTKTATTRTVTQAMSGSLGMQ